MRINCGLCNLETYLEWTAELTFGEENYRICPNCSVEIRSAMEKCIKLGISRDEE